MDAEKILNEAIALAEKFQAQLGAGIDAVKLFRDRLFPQPPGLKTTQAVPPQMSAEIDAAVERCKSGS